MVRAMATGSRVRSATPKCSRSDPGGMVVLSRGFMVWVWTIE